MQKNHKSFSIAFASGKGGTGKTTLAFNFANYLAQKNKVILLDLDVEEPNASLFLKNSKSKKQDIGSIKVPIIDEQKCDLCGVCSSKCNFNALNLINNKIKVFNELCKSCLACAIYCPNNAINYIEQEIGIINQYQQGRLLLIEGKLKQGDIHSKALIKLVKNYADHLETTFKIIDCPPGTTCPMVEAVLDADFVFLVAESTLFSLNDLKIAVEVMENIDKDFAVIINKEIKDAKIIELFCFENKIKIAEKIDFDGLVYSKLARGESIFDIDWYQKKMLNLEFFLRKVFYAKNSIC